MNIKQKRCDICTVWTDEKELKRCGFVDAYECTVKHNLHRVEKILEVRDVFICPKCLERKEGIK